MKAIQRTFILSGLTALVLFACTKDRHTRGCEDTVNLPCNVDTNRVSIRVTNQTGFPICDFSLEFNKDSILQIGTLSEGDSICYFAVDSTVYAPGMKFKVGTTDFKVLFGSGGTSYFDSKNSLVTYDIEMKQRIDTATFKPYYIPSSRPIVIQN
jgi:hypothetical protein